VQARLSTKQAQGRADPSLFLIILFQRPVVGAGAQPLIDEKLEVVNIDYAVAIEVRRQVTAGLEPVIGKPCESGKSTKHKGRRARNRPTIHNCQPLNNLHPADLSYRLICIVPTTRPAPPSIVLETIW